MEYELKCPVYGCSFVGTGSSPALAAVNLYDHGEPAHALNLMSYMKTCGADAPEGEGWCVLPEGHTQPHESLREPAPMTWR